MFVKVDVGLRYRKKNGDKNDCQVRALSKATDMHYHDAYKMLYQIQGEFRYCSFCLVEALNRKDKRLPLIATMPFPAKRGQPRMTANEFCSQNPKGNFILRMAHHVAAVRDGILYDTWDSSSKCVYTAWEVKSIYE